MDNNEKITPVGVLGEFGLITHLTKNVEWYNASTIVGIGDDAAMISPLTPQSLISSDMLIEGVHFDLFYTPLKYLGYKSVIVNLSDIYAMNGTPTQIVVNIGISNRFAVEDLEQLYAGINEACEKYHVDLIGGDTCSSNKGLIISITAIGEINDKKIVKRSGAQPNDLIVVSGDLGGAYGGLLILEREKKIISENPKIVPQYDNQQYAIRRLLKPEAQKETIELLDSLNIIPTAMMDISDGLSSELLHICKQSNVGCVVYENKIPVHPDVKQLAMDFELTPSSFAMNGGEDYELLFTISPKDYDKIKDVSLLSVIGYITDTPTNKHLISNGGQQITITAQGWQAF